MRLRLQGPGNSVPDCANNPILRGPPLAGCTPLTGMSFLALYPLWHFLEQRQSPEAGWGSQARAGVRPVGGSKELTVRTRTKENIVILR